MFTTNIMNAQRNGSIIATGLPVQLDTVNIDIILTSQNMIPFDSYDAYCDSSPLYVPQRSDYLIDHSTGAKYQFAGNPAIYSDHWEARLTRYLSTTP